MNVHYRVELSQTMFLDVHRPWRKVKVTTSRAAIDFAACMRDLADARFTAAERPPIDYRDGLPPCLTNRRQVDFSISTQRRHQHPPAKWSRSIGTAARDPSE